MKVHKFQFEVMWLILAVLSGWVTTRLKWKLEPQPARQDHMKEKNYSPYQSRPPPFRE